MTVHQIFPNPWLGSGIKSLLSEEDMLSFFKKFCEAIKSQTRKVKRGKNARYRTEDFLRVFLFAETAGKAILDASEELNEYYLKKKKGKRQMFSDGRKRREVPHQTDVNCFLRRIGIEKARAILRECIFYQLRECLERDIVSKDVDILIDFNERGYYGKRKDFMIKGTTRLKGTKKMRHYLMFSILSKNDQFFTGLEHVAKKQKKTPLILDFLNWLRAVGFTTRNVAMDREFYEAELIELIKALKTDVTMPVKSYKKVKQFIVEYLQDKEKRIRKYTISSAPGNVITYSQEVYLVICAKKGTTLIRAKRDFKRGKLTLNEAAKQLFAIMTTEKPKGKTSSWASRICRFYRSRWFIETGISDINRIAPSWKSSHDNVRYIDLLMRMVIYNEWKAIRVLAKKSGEKRYKSRPWKLAHAQSLLSSLILSWDKKLEGSCKRD